MEHVCHKQLNADGSAALESVFKMFIRNKIQTNTKYITKVKSICIFQTA